MNIEALLNLWNTDDFPACPEGMELARTFLIGCGQGVTLLGTEDPSDRITEITEAYATMVDHAGLCDDCKGV
jgi:hypothetical protein